MPCNTLFKTKCFGFGLAGCRVIAENSKNWKQFLFQVFWLLKWTVLIVLLFDVGSTQLRITMENPGMTTPCIQLPIHNIWLSTIHTHTLYSYPKYSVCYVVVYPLSNVAWTLHMDGQHWKIQPLFICLGQSQSTWACQLMYLFLPHRPLRDPNPELTRFVA